METPYILSVSSPFKKAARAVSQSPILMAMVVVLFVNVFLALKDPFGRVDPNTIPSAKHWAYWTTQDFLKEKAAPDVVLLGSSIFMNPLWMLEAEHLNRTVDIVVERRSHYLEDALKKKLPGARLSCFNYALPGAMVSDDYMIIRTMFKEGKTPKVVVIGLTPLDMTDDDFYCAVSSTHYKYLAKFTRTRDLLDLAMPKPWQRTEYLANESVYLAGRKHDVQGAVIGSVRDNLSGYLGPLSATPLSTKEKGDVKDAIYQDEVAPGIWLAQPVGIDYFNDNSNGFKKRYRFATPDKCKIKMAWLKKCIDLCKEKNIEPLIVNVPLPDPALKILPAGVHEALVKRVEELAQTEKVAYIDLQKTGAFDIKDFTDSCHMDASGGRKVMDFVAGEIGKDARLSSALIDPANFALTNPAPTKLDPTKSESQIAGKRGAM
ncbi:MAG: hypothetical protein C0507_20065 [Cyanobacteria bacterium PR.3.49]|jgi:hypothetical protein|nr:hypothetical protein [Cyanobacteria bacterium PR.3.49]